MDTLSYLIVTSGFSKRDKLRDPEILADERRLQPITKKLSVRDSGKSKVSRCFTIGVYSIWEDFELGFGGAEIVLAELCRVCAFVWRPVFAGEL